MKPRGDLPQCGAAYVKVPVELPKAYKITLKAQRAGLVHELSGSGTIRDAGKDIVRSYGDSLCHRQHRNMGRESHADFFCFAHMVKAGVIVTKSNQSQFFRIDQPGHGAPELSGS